MKPINKEREYMALNGESINPDQLLPRYKAYQVLERKYPGSIMLFTDHSSFEAYGAAWSLIKSDLGIFRISPTFMTHSKHPEDATVAVWISVDGIEKELIKICGMGHSVLICTLTESIYRIHRVKVDSSTPNASFWYSEEEAGEILPCRIFN